MKSVDISAGLGSNDRELLLSYPDRPNTTRSFDSERGDIKVYKKRWYILSMFFGLCVSQGVIYNTWAPIQSTARAVYKWDSFMIDLMPALGCIAPCFTIVPLGWLMDVKGLRTSVLLAAGCQFLGAALRCIPGIGNWSFSTLLICCGQTLSGLVAPIALSGGVLLSATWFPSNQRTASTAIVMAGGFMGSALSFIVGPFLVDDVGSMDFPKQGDNYLLNFVDRQRFLDQINALLVTEAGLMAVLLLGIFLHFPARPPSPPSASSGFPRADFNGSLTKLLENSNFLLLALLYGVSCGVYSGWCSVLDQNLSEFGVGQTFAGWLGFIAVVAGAFSGILFSLSMDTSVEMSDVINNADQTNTPQPASGNQPDRPSGELVAVLSSMHNGIAETNALISRLITSFEPNHSSTSEQVEHTPKRVTTTDQESEELAPKRARRTPKTGQPVSDKDHADVAASGRVDPDVLSLFGRPDVSEAGEDGENEEDTTDDFLTAISQNLFSSDCK